MSTSNDNASPRATTTPALDALATALAGTLPPELGWQLRGWASHIREARAAQHAANSFAKHRRELVKIEREAHALVVAACFDFGLDCDAACLLIRERVAAREAKAVAA